MRTLKGRRQRASLCCIARMFTVITWLLYSPHWEPPPLRWLVVVSTLASGSNTMRMQRAEHTLQPGGLVKDRRDIAATVLVCPCFVSESGGGTQVLHHERLCWLSLQVGKQRKCLYYVHKIECCLTINSCFILPISQAHTHRHASLCFCLSTTNRTWT